jgi:hypothetical protein
MQGHILSHCAIYWQFIDWAEDTLTHVLKLRAPAGLEGIVTDVGPLLYRIVLHLGYYPYLLQPKELLTIDVLRTAVILVLSKYQFRGWQDKEDRKSYIGFLEKKTRRFLFQVMMQEGSPNEKYSNQRSDEDDEDLLAVLQALQELDNGKEKRR